MFTFAGKKIFLIAVCLSFEMTCAKDERKMLRFKEHFPIHFFPPTEIGGLVYHEHKWKLANMI